MRRWFFVTAAVLSLSLMVVIGSNLISGGKAAPEVQPPTPKYAKSRIDKVTVYPTNALITREVEVPDGDGLIELIINPMPEQIVPSTLYSEGAEGLRVLTTRFSTRQVLEDTSKARRELESEMEKLQIAGAKIQSDIASLQQNMQLLSKLESVAEKGKHTGDEVIALTKYVMEQRSEKAKEMVGIMELKRQNNVKIEFCQRKTNELGGVGGKMERDAIIVVDRENGKGGTVRLNYLVGSVTWRPEYKLRAGKVTEDVQVDYLANLRQNSGEDWSHVKMTLSTAQPMLSASPPELCMLEPVLLRRGQPGGPPMPTAAMPAFDAYANPISAKDIAKKAKEGRAQAGQLNSLGNSTNFSGNSFNPNAGLNAPPAMPQAPGLPLPPVAMPVGPQGYTPSQAFIQKEADRILNESAALEQNLDLMQTRDEVLANVKKKRSPTQADAASTEGPSVTYHLPNKLSVPSRNDEQVVEIVKLNLTPKYYYKAVPVLNRHVYRLADLVNKSSHELLPGEATMYQGTDFVGRMPMPLVAIGEEFTAGFGVDTQLQIQRQMVDQNRSTLGGNQVLSYNYRLLISSYKKEPVKLQLWDRLPKGENESVTVTLVKQSPSLSEDGIYKRESRPSNLLRWDLEVPANSIGEKAMPVTYEFSMQLDRQMAITGFQSR